MITDKPVKTMFHSLEDIQQQKRVDVLEAYKQRPGVLKKERRLINRQINRQIARVKLADAAALVQLELEAKAMQIG